MNLGFQQDVVIGDIICRIHTNSEVLFNHIHSNYILTKKTIKPKLILKINISQQNNEYLPHKLEVDSIKKLEEFARKLEMKGYNFYKSNNKLRGIYNELNKISRNVEEEVFRGGIEDPISKTRIINLTINNLDYNLLDYYLMRIFHLFFFHCGILLNRFLFHVAALVHNNQLYLFTGPSGYGKTTLSGILKSKYNILNDDSVIVKNDQGKFLVYNLPGYNTSPNNIFKFDGLKIKKIFLIHKSKENTIKSVSHVESYRYLIRALVFYARVFDSKKEMEKVSSLLLSLIENIEIKNLYFRKDKSVIKLIEKELE